MQRDAAEPRLRRGVGHEHDVVLILPARVLSLRREHADDGERHVADLDLRPTGSRPGKRFFATVVRRAPRPCASLRTSSSLKNVAARRLPVADRLVVGGHAVDRRCASSPCRAITCVRVTTTGDTPASSVASRLSFSASSTVRRLNVCAPWLTPPVLLAPGVMTMQVRAQAR